MPANKARRFTKIQYEDPEDIEIIESVYISSEKHRINCILRNLNNNVEFITMLHDVLQLNADSDIMDSELSRALQEHLKLERLEMLEDHKVVSDGKKETTQLEKKIKTSFRNLLRLLKAHHLLPSAWKKGLGMETGKCESALIKEFDVLGGLEPKPQLAGPNPVFSDLKDRQDFTATMEEITIKISQKSQEIKILQSCLQKKREEESTLQEQLQTTTEDSEKMQKKLQQEVNEMRIQLNDRMYSHFEEETVLRQKIKRVDAVTESFVEDFDGEMEALQASLVLNTMKYEQEVEEVKKLEILYTELDVEYRCLLEKHQLAEKKKGKDAKELMLKTEAALLIQAWWRGFCVRKALKQREKKDKKNKKEKYLKEIDKIGQKDTKVKRKVNGKKTI